MIAFFRHNQRIIGWTLCIVFLGTLFTGAVFSGNFSNLFGGGNTPIRSAQMDSVASLGDIFVTRSDYYRSVRAFLGMASSMGQPISPDFREMLFYNAFTQSLNRSILLDYAYKNEIKVLRSDLNSELESTYLRENVKNLGELKGLLKKNNIRYKDYLTLIKKDILVKKAIKKLEEGIVVSEKDVQNQYRELKLRDIFFKVSGDVDKEKILENATNVFERLQSNQEKDSFEALAKEFSDDLETKTKGGDLGWRKFSDFSYKFASFVFSLKMGEISPPFKATGGYHIVKLENQRDLKNKPKDFDMEKEKKRLLDQWRSQASNFYIDEKIEEEVLKIDDPVINAYRSKMYGQLDEAKGYYNLMSSQATYDPLPHYFLAKIHISQGNVKEAHRMFELAKLKISLDKKLDFPELHFAFSEFVLTFDKDKKKGEEYLINAFELAKANKSFLKSLSKLAEKFNLKKALNLVNSQIKVLDEEEKKEKEVLEKEMKGEKEKKEKKEGVPTNKRDDSKKVD